MRPTRRPRGCLTHDLANLKMHIQEYFLDLDWQAQIKVLEHFLVSLNHYQRSVVSVSLLLDRKPVTQNPLVVSNEWHCLGCGKQEVWSGDYQYSAELFKWFGRTHCSKPCFNATAGSLARHCQLCGRKFVIGNTQEHAAGLLYCARHAFWWRNF